MGNPGTLGRGGNPAGGGGYYGGGGAGYHIDAVTYTKLDGGAGGGSGFGPAATTFQTGVNVGNGMVTITYTPSTK